MPEIFGNAYAQFVRFAATGATLFEGCSTVGSGRVLRVRRLSVFTNNQVSTTGAVIQVELWRTTNVGRLGGSVPTRVFRVLPEPDDPTEEIPSGVEFWSGRGVTTTGIMLRRQTIVADDVNLASSHNTMSYMSMEVPYAVLFDANCAVAVQPLVFRAGEGFALVQNGALAAGWCDYEALFSAE